jgi:hypothetical protein
LPFVGTHTLSRAGLQNALADVLGREVVADGQQSFQEQVRARGCRQQVSVALDTHRAGAMDDLDAVKRIAGMPKVALVFLIPLVNSIEVHDDVLAQFIIRGSKGCGVLVRAGKLQVERRAIGGVHRERNAGVIDRAFAEMRNGAAECRHLVGCALGGRTRYALELPNRYRVTGDDPFRLPDQQRTVGVDHDLTPDQAANPLVHRLVAKLTETAHQDVSNHHPHDQRIAHVAVTGDMMGGYDRAVAGTGPEAGRDELIGREPECAAIDRLLRDATRGDSGSLVIRGEPGIGKSTLLAHAEHAAADSIVLRTAGQEAESDLAFGGLYGLLRPVADRLNDLPEHQAAALGSALGLVEPAPMRDRFLVAAATLSVLAAAAYDHPLLCLIDDAQWLDSASSDALLFAARRLRAEPVAMLFAVRDEGGATAFPATGLPEMVVDGLKPAAAAQLLTSAAPAAAEATQAWLLAEAA